MEIAMKNQPRRTDDLDPELRQKIQERAYYLWLADDRPEGAQLEYWFRAEEEVTGGTRQDQTRASDELGRGADHL
jgi:hypothetical protein